MTSLRSLRERDFGTRSSARRTTIMWKKALASSVKQCGIVRSRYWNAGDELLGVGRVERSRQDDDHVDAERLHLGAKRVGDRLHRVFGHVIGTAALGGDAAGKRTDVDDPAAPGPPHA